MNDLQRALKDALERDAFDELHLSPDEIGSVPLAYDECHANAARWVARYPGWSVVEGWLLQGSMGPGTGAFAKHSVVEDPNGQLVDITPRRSDDGARSFARHDTELMGSFEAAPAQEFAW